MSKTETVSLKSEFRSINTIAQAIELDNRFNYWDLSKRSEMVRDFRDKKCTIKACKLCMAKGKDHLKTLKYLPKSVVVTIKNGEQGVERFRLDENHIQKIHEYRNDLQIQAFDRNAFDKINPAEPIPTMNVFSNRYAPLYLEPTFNHLVTIFGKPTLEQNYQGLGIMVQFNPYGDTFNGKRESLKLERINWIPTVLFSHNLSEKSFLYGFTAGVVFCENQMFLNSPDEMNKGMIRHTSGNINRFNLDNWTTNWLSGITKIESLIEKSMNKLINEVYEIMFYFKTAQSVPMLLDLFTRPQIDKPKTQWDLAMNVTRLNSPQFKSKLSNKYEDEKLFLSGHKSSNMLMNEYQFKFGDFLKALTQIENQFHNIISLEKDIKVNISDFYNFCSTIIDERSVKMQNKSLSEAKESLNDVIDIDIIDA